MLVSPGLAPVTLTSRTRNMFTFQSATDRPLRRVAVRCLEAVDLGDGAGVVKSEWTPVCAALYPGQITLSPYAHGAGPGPEWVEIRWRSSLFLPCAYNSTAVYLHDMPYS